jgi:hypothetical protein
MRAFQLFRLWTGALALTVSVSAASAASGGEVRFERVQLSNEFYSEGGTAADLDNDGHGDVIVGPWIYWGPDFETKTRYYEGEPFHPIGYSKNFLMYSDDVDGDGLVDTIVLGFPGDESWWYRNPGKEQARQQLWERFTILDVVDNESPMIVDIDGDGIKDLVCSSKGHYGYASRAGQDPTQMWKFHAVSPNNGYGRFTHGIGVGDVNNDGRMDLLEKDGWWENPGPRTGEAAQQPWKHHAVALANPGGSQMFALDLDGNGKNEILTGLSAHGYGLVYHRVIDGRGDQLETVEIMTRDAGTSPTGIAISQLHAVDIGDINGDGIPDIITGKRWWAHGPGDEGAHMPASLVWFETQRAGDRVRFVPHVIDNSSGVGTQVMLVDVNGDGLLDVVSGNKRGAYLFLQVPADRPAGEPLVPGLAAKDPFHQQLARTSVPVADEFGGVRPALAPDRPLNFDFESGDTRDWEVRGTFAPKALVETAALEQGQGAQGKFAIRTAGDKQHEDVGEVISRPFVVTHPWISFLVGGGQADNLAVHVVSEETGKVIAEASGTGEPTLRRVALDLSSHVGQPVRIRLVDHHGGASLVLDDIRLHAHSVK